MVYENNSKTRNKIVFYHGFIHCIWEYNIIFTVHIIAYLILYNKKYIANTQLLLLMHDDEIDEIKWNQNM